MLVIGTDDDVGDGKDVEGNDADNNEMKFGRASRVLFSRYISLFLLLDIIGCCEEHVQGIMYLDFGVSCRPTNLDLCIYTERGRHFV